MTKTLWIFVDGAWQEIPVPIGVASLNGLAGDVTLSPGTNIALNPTGNDIEIENTYSLPPAVYNRFGTSYESVNGGAGKTFSWATLGGSSPLLLDLTDPLAPTVIENGIYTFSAAIQAQSLPSTEEMYISLTIVNAGIAFQDAPGFNGISSSASVSVTVPVLAGTVVTLYAENGDTVARNFRVLDASVLKHPYYT